RRGIAGARGSPPRAPLSIRSRRACLDAESAAARVVASPFIGSTCREDRTPLEPPSGLLLRHGFELLDEQLLDHPGELGDRGAREEPAQRHVDLEGRAYAREGAGREKRIAAEVEEAFLDADAVAAQQLRPDRRDGLLGWIPRGDAHAA